MLKQTKLNEQPCRDDFCFPSYLIVLTSTLIIQGYCPIIHTHNGHVKVVDN